MTYNLMHERWIPVRGEDGRIEKIAPWELTQETWAGFAAPRPDFNGALAQFCIGLLQTACTPPDETHWRQWFEKPPPPEELKKLFTAAILEGFRLDSAFNLDGDGPRFMQDFEELAVESKPIEWLLMDAAVENTINENRDHFVKRDQVGRVCQSCASIALFTMQTHAPAGGPGYMSSLRGNSPLTTLALGDALWPTLWLNVLDGRLFAGYPGLHDVPDHPSKIFPWLAKTRVSKDKKSKQREAQKLKTNPANMHALHQYWGMPCRIRLDSDSVIDGTCGVCGSNDEALFSRYFTDNYGMDYESWEHVLSPSERMDGGTAKPVRLRPGGITYRHWLGVVEGFQEKTRKNSRVDCEPARVITALRGFDARKRVGRRVWAFGYDMDKRKARCWYEAKMPVYFINDEIKRKEFPHSVETCVMAATIAANGLKRALFCISFGKMKKVELPSGNIWWEFEKDKRATYRAYNDAIDEPGQKSDTRGESKDATFLASVSSAFWQATESDFYRFLQDLKEKLEAGEPREAAHPAWYAAIKNAALRLFEEAADSGGLVGNLKARVYARTQLEDLFDSPYLKNQILRLPS